MASAATLGTPPADLTPPPPPPAAKGTLQTTEKTVTATPLTTTVTAKSQTSRFTPQQSCCNLESTLKMVALAVIIVGLIAGAAGLAVFLGHAQISITGIGLVTKEMALITMLSGFGATFISTLLLSVYSSLSKSKEAGQHGKQSMFSCCASKVKSGGLQPLNA